MKHINDVYGTELKTHEDLLNFGSFMEQLRDFALDRIYDSDFAVELYSEGEKLSTGKMLELYKHTDAVLITDRNGFIEYSTMISSDIKNFKNAEVTGKHILEIYTSLTEETSTIMRVLRDGKPIIDEKQKVINDRGEIIYLINSTFPIEVNNEIIGAIEASVYADGNFENSNLHTIEIKANKNDKKLYTLNDIITNDHKVLDIKNKIRRIAVNNSSVN